MKKSTTVATMANGLLKVLQRYTKGIRLVAVLTMLLIVGIGQAWGADVTFTANVDKGETSVTKDGITVSMSTMSRTDNYRTYASTDMNVSSETATITKIVITCTGSGTNNYGPGKFSGTGYTYSNSTGTWTGSSTSISLTASAQVRITKIVVTYTAGSGNTGDDNTGGGGDGECTWQLVTDASILNAGDHVVIAASGYDYALGADRGNNRAAVAITKNKDNTITINNNVQILTLETGTVANTFAFHTGTSGYLYAASSSGNQLKTKTTKDVNGAFTIEINNGTTNIQAKSSSNRNIIKYNDGNSPKIFSCYSSGQQAICLYKEQCTAETSYSVTWNLNGGNWSGNTNNQVDSYEEGESIRTPADPTRTGYTFNGWDPTPDTQMGTSDLTYTAQWTANTITITWNQNYTDCPGAVTSEYTYDGEEIIMPENPIRTGYKFNGWFTASSGGTQITDVGNTNKPAENTTYYAQWKKEHTIKWIVNGDTDTPYETTYVVDDDALELPSNPDAPSTCEEKVFIGWTEAASVNADGSDIEYVDENTLPNTDKNYYAVFASLDGDADGDYKKVTSALSDWSGEYLIVYETGNIAFDGGQEQEYLNDGYKISITIEDNTIKATTEMDNARFTVAKITDGYSVKSASGYYIGCTAQDKGLYSSQDTQYLNQISWGKPWDSAEEGVIIKSQNDPILLYSTTAGRFRYYSSAQETISLYRKSSYTDYTTVCVETFKVTYDANSATSGNVPVDENNYVLDATVTVLGNTGNLQKTHYSFVEWNTQADGNGTSYQAGETFTITEDVTLYAIWEELPQYSVTWYVNGKQLTDVELNDASTTVYEGDRITKTPPAPNPEDFCGQVFAGWTDAEMDVNDTNKPTIYNLVDEFPTASGDQTFYAVFADYDEQQ